MNSEYRSGIPSEDLACEWRCVKVYNACQNLKI